MELFSTFRFWLAALTVVITSLVSFGQGGIVTQRIAPIGIINFGEGTFTGWSKDNFIDGYVRKQGDGQFTFPVGHNMVYAPFATVGNGTDGAFYSLDPNTASAANSFAGGPFATSTMENRLKLVSSEFFWDVNSDQTSKLTLSWSSNNPVSSLAPDDLSKITIVGWDGFQWIDIPSTVDNTSLYGTTSSMITGSVTTQSAFRLNQYQVYTLASLPSSSLPVKLVSFTGNTDEQLANLLWTTTEEVNVDKFVVQTSLDAKSWKDIGNVVSIADNVNQVNEYSFIQNSPSGGSNYYRLMMLDQDGTFAYSNIVTLRFAVEDKITIYPNPVAEKLFIKTDASQNVKSVVFRNISGVIQFESGNDASAGIDIRHLNRGIYFLTISMVDGSQDVRKVLISR